MQILAFHCPEAPEHLRWVAKVYDMVRGKMEVLTVVFYRRTKEEAVAAAQLDYDTKLSAEARRREPKPKKAGDGPVEEAI